MSKPNIFVSSIYIDLKEVKATLDDFISQYGYDVKMIAKGGVPYDYDKFTDVSCYEEVKQSDLYILIIGGRYVSLATEKETQIRQKMKKYNLITINEYKAALSSQVPIYIFIDRMVFSEYSTWKLNKDKNIIYAHVDNNNIFELIKEIYKSGLSKNVKEFSNAKDISNWLRTKWAEMFKELLISKKNKHGKTKKNKVPINCYKLFYYRHSRKIEIVDIAKMSNISASKYRVYERPVKKFKNGRKIYPTANEIDVHMIAMNLELHKSELMIGNIDDHSYQYYEYYSRYKGKRFNAKPIAQKSIFPVRVLVFDFDGTLTSPDDNLTTWEKLWLKAGYTVNDCAKYHKDFADKVINHKEWCDITLKYFQKGRLTETVVKEVASKIRLLNDTNTVLQLCESKGISLHLL